MNILDLILAIPLGLLIWRGFRKGAVFEVSTLIGLVAGLWLAARLCRWVVGLMDWDGDTAILVAFFITFVAVVLLARLAGRLVERFVKLVHAGFLNSLLGALFGMLRCVVILSVLIYYVEVIDSHSRLLTPQAKKESLLYRPVTRTGDRVIGTVKHYVALHKENCAC